MVFLSIIIPTIGRKNELDSLLNSIFYTSKFNKQFEVIIVNQNPIGYLDDVLTKYLPKENLKIYNVSFKGLSKAKNFGFSKSSGEFVTFPDDDCLLFEDTYQTAIDLIEKYNLDIVSGKCIDEDKNDSVQKFKKKDYFLNLKNLKGGFIEATCVIRKELMYLFPFDENLGAGTYFGAHEGFDWLYRILKCKIYNIYYSQSIVFFHPQVISFKGNHSSLIRVNSYTNGFVYSRLKNNLYWQIFKRLIIVFLLIALNFFWSWRVTRYYLVEFTALISSLIISREVLKFKVI